MKKNSIKKLAINKLTVSNIETRDLATIKGGGIPILKRDMESGSSAPNMC